MDSSASMSLPCMLFVEGPWTSEHSHYVYTVTPRHRFILDLFCVSLVLCTPCFVSLTGNLTNLGSNILIALIFWLPCICRYGISPYLRGLLFLNFVSRVTLFLNLGHWLLKYKREFFMGMWRGQYVLVFKWRYLPYFWRPSRSICNLIQNFICFNHSYASVSLFWKKALLWNFWRKKCQIMSVLQDHVVWLVIPWLQYFWYSCLYYSHQ